MGPEIVISTLESPTVILQGTTEPGYVIYLNQEFTSPRNSPLAVVVDPSANPLPAVATFGFRKDFKDISQKIVVWSRPGK